VTESTRRDLLVAAACVAGTAWLLYVILRRHAGTGPE
jgi:hypothetical protein